MGKTCTTMTDDIVGRHMTSGEDENELGRWTYACITRKDNRKLYVITRYCPCIQTNFRNRNSKCATKTTVNNKGETQCTHKKRMR
eukprot:11872661-Ditylum_brightwellii.AAC.1